MIARHLAARLPEVIALHHRAAVLMNLRIAFSTFRVIRTTWKLDTCYLPAVLVEQDKHGIQRCLLKGEVLTYLNRLEKVVFLFKDLCILSGG